jgi:glycosyltransferase involved in cell wall biosynthesis
MLVVKTINGKHHPEAEAELRAGLASLPHVAVIDTFLTRQQTWDLQSCCDMLVSLHRAEGFGLAPAEMMYLGKPVVATGWSANTDFMNHENSMPVDFVLKPLAETLGAYPAGPVWAEADIGHAADCIGRLLDDADLRERIGQRAARDIRRQLDPEAVGKLVASRLNAIAHWRPELR